MGKDLWNAVYSQRELIFRMLASCILGGAIGFERKHRHKGAGMRTHALVCLGSALMMIVSKYGFTDFPDIDGSRIAAQVVSGIGFLGAGVIFVRNNAVNGLTTAAGLWVTSGIGLSIATVIVICVQFVLHNIRVLANEPYRANVRVEYMDDEQVLKEVEEVLKKDKISIAAMKMRKKNSGKIDMDIEAVFPAGYEKVEVLNKISELKGVSIIDI